MGYNDVARFARENPIFTIATMDGDQPRVRGFLSIFFEGDDRIYFTTSTQKNVGRQLVKNPKVELCYLSQDSRTMLRITGVVDFVNDLKMKEEIINRQFYLKGFAADDPSFILGRISHGKARFWTLADNMREAAVPVIEF